MDSDKDRYIGGQTIACQDCNEPKNVYPPSSEYVETRLESCPRGDVRQAFFDCENCNKRIHFIGINDMEMKDSRPLLGS
jgi:hypothetical protein